MTTSAEHELPVDEDDATSDGAWELPELIAAAIVISTALLTVGGVCSGWLFANQNNVQGDGAWFAIQQTARSFDVVTCALLLGALAANWWQYTQWTGHARSDENEAAATMHVQRILRLTWWTQVGFVVSCVGIVMYALSTIAIYQGIDFGHPVRWAEDLTAGFGALSTLVIAAVGLVAGRRLLAAATAYLSQI